MSISRQYDSFDSRKNINSGWDALPRRIFLYILLLVPIVAWKAAGAGAAADDNLTEGARVFFRICATCHGPQGKGTDTAPSLEAMRNRQEVVEMVFRGRGKMPSFANTLSRGQIEAVADYVSQKLAVLTLEGGNLGEGGTLYRDNCSPCHRTAVRGGALAFAKMNAPTLTGLSGEEIAGFVRSGPGPMPAFPPSVISDGQLASIIKYVRFMQRPPHPGGLPMRYYGPVAEGLVAVVVTIFLVFIAGWIERGGKG